jgi:hypothetical protein
VRLVTIDGNFTTFCGTAPTSVAAGQAAIGGGEGWFGSSIHLNPQIWHYLGGAKTLYVDTAGGYFRLRTVDNLQGFAFQNQSGSSHVVIENNGLSTFYGTAPTSVAAGQSAIGGGEGWFAALRASSLSRAGVASPGLVDGIVFQTDGHLDFGVPAGTAQHFFVGSTIRFTVQDTQAEINCSTIPDRLVSTTTKVRIGGGAVVGPKHMDTPDGGRAILIKNQSGSTSVKGRLVQASPTYDDAYTVSTADRPNVIGVEYESGVPDGILSWVVVSGIADVLLADGTAATRGYWAKQSDTVGGRADITNQFPPGGTITALDDHGSEIGHCIQSVTAGTTQTARCVLHFN